MLHATLFLLESTTFDGSHPAVSAYTLELNGQCDASRSVWHRLCAKGQGRVDTTDEEHELDLIRLDYSNLAKKAREELRQGISDTGSPDMDKTDSATAAITGAPHED
jgi:hypothetical protein